MDAERIARAKEFGWCISEWEIDDWGTYYVLVSPKGDVLTRDVGKYSEALETEDEAWELLPDDFEIWGTP